MKKYDDIHIADRELVEGCLKNDRSSQELLYRKYAKKMLRLSRLYASTTDEAQDILQEAFLKVFRNLETYTEGSSLEGWIRRIVSNTAIDHYRQSRRKGFFQPLEEDTTWHDEAVVEPSLRLDTEDVYRAVNELPDGARMVFHLYAVQGYSHKEIAEQLNVSESTSKSQYQRARSLLVERLNEREAG